MFFDTDLISAFTEHGVGGLVVIVVPGSAVLGHGTAIIAGRRVGAVAVGHRRIDDIVVAEVSSAGSADPLALGRGCAQLPHIALAGLHVAVVIVIGIDTQIGQIPLAHVADVVGVCVDAQPIRIAVAHITDVVH